MNPDAAWELIESERAQIAHEIHDALLPLLFAASAAVQRQLDDLSAEGAETERLQQASQWLQQALQTGRNILIHSHPPELENQTWDRAAQLTIGQLSSQQLNIDWQIDDDSSNVADAIAGTCYRIVVEAVRNAIRHGGATQATISAKRQQNNLIVTVTDNGSGFDTSAIPSDRFGIRSMTGRAKLLGGTVSIDSQPGGPTTVHCAIPL